MFNGGTFEHRFGGDAGCILSRTSIYTSLSTRHAVHCPLPCSLGRRHRRQPAPLACVAVVAQDNQSCKFAQKLSRLPAVLLRVMLTPSSVAPKVGTVGPDSCFRHRRMPELGLERKSSFAWRVYVLDCGDGLMYVGIALSKNIGERIRMHFQGKGAHFTREHKPKSILFCWPAAHPAVEGMVFLSLLSLLPPWSVRKLGGWTQTSTKPSPLSSLVFEQERRCMTGACFNCGSASHLANECTKPLETVEYRVEGFDRPVQITNRGASIFGAELASEEAASSRETSAPVLPMSVAPGHGKRKAKVSSASEPNRKAPKTESGGRKIVLVGGKQYTSLSWFLNNPNPYPKYCRLAKAHCYSTAIELRCGDVRTLDLGGYASTLPFLPQCDVLGDRVRIPSNWLVTDVCADKNNKLELRKTGSYISRTLRQVLWLVADLERWVAKSNGA